jgi:hypothetical protein
MEYKPDDDKIKFPIYGWKNINLLNEKPLICNQPLKKKKKEEQKLCQKNAKYVVVINNQEIYYCGSHSKDYVGNTGDTFFINTDKDQICYYTKDDKKCNKKASFYRSDDENNKIFYCTIHKKKYDLDNSVDEYKLIKKSEFDVKYNCLLCSKNATYYSELDESNTYCSKHKKKLEMEGKLKFYLLKDKQIIRKCENLDKECQKPAVFFKKSGSEVKFYCSLHKNNCILKEKNDSILQLIKKKKANKISIDYILRELIIQLDKIPELLQVDEIIIENQPSLKNPKMKTVSSALYTYFLIRGIIDKDKNNSKIKDIHFISPSNKLKVDQDNTLKILSKTENDKKYKLTKALGIKYCKQLIQYDENSIKLLEELTKKDKPDDLCDAMIQGAYYLLKNA